MSFVLDSIGAFDPLLRDLLQWDLVEPVDAGDGSATQWRLTDRAQRRLNDLVVHRAVPSPDRIMYLDHRCTGCGARKPTRLRDGDYVCDPCAESSAQRAGSGAVGEPPVAGPTHGRHARAKGSHRSTPPVAS